MGLLLFVFLIFFPTSHLCSVCLQWLSWQMKFWLLIKFKIADILWQWSLSPSYITSNSNCAWFPCSAIPEPSCTKHSSWPTLRWEGGRKGDTECLLLHIKRGQESFNCNYQSLESSLCWYKHWETSALACPFVSLAEAGLSSRTSHSSVTGDQCDAPRIRMQTFLMSASQTCSSHPTDSSSSILGKRQSVQGEVMAGNLCHPLG